MAELTYQSAWRDRNDKFERDAIAFWTTNNLLPSDVDPGQRASQLCAVVYDDEKLVGLATAFIAPLPSLRAPFAFLRCAVSPTARRGHVASTLTEMSFSILARWAAANPIHGPAGMAMVLQSGALADVARKPFWPPRESNTPSAGMGLVGYTDTGEQIRVAWFDSYRLA